MPIDNADAALRGRRIGVPESRRLDLFADMLEGRGARVVRCPLVAIVDSPDQAAVAAWLDDVIERGLDDMIWLTGEGVRRLVACAERRSGAARCDFLRVLAGARAVTRGPKPTRELRALGLGSDLAGREPTTAGVIAALEPYELGGRRIGVQRYGSDPNRPLMDFLAARGAVALAVAPYAYADDADEAQVVDFIDAAVRGALDAVAFTSSPQIRRLFGVARRHERLADLVAGLNRLCVAAVGPLVAERLRAAGVTVDLVPEDRYFMKPLVRALVDHFTL